MSGNVAKIIILTIIVSSLGLGGYYFFSAKKINEDLYKYYEKVNYKLESRNLRLLVADTPEKKEKGLMFYRSLEGVDGMIFTYESDQILNFWNGNTYMDLNIYWINDNKVIKKDFLPSIERGKQVTVTSEVPVDTVIEVPAN